MSIVIKSTIIIYSISINENNFVLLFTICLYSAQFLAKNGGKVTPCRRD